MTALDGDRARLDQLILGEGPLDDLKPFLPDRKSRIIYYSERVPQLIATNRATTQCECCKQRAVEENVLFHWRAIYHTAGTFIATLIGILMAMGGHGVLPHKRVDFETTHGLCRTCLKQISQRKLLAQLVEKLCFIVLILSLLVFVPMLIFAPVILFSGPIGTREILVSLAAIGGGGALIFASLVFADKASRWHVPNPLRFISKRPFQLVSIQVSNRNLIP